MWADGELLRPLDDTRAGMTVKVPVNDGRDLTELVFRTVGGVEQLQSNGSIFRRVDSGALALRAVATARGVARCA
jgi:hypothetical protein